jgi:hypothetical protein
MKADFVVVRTDAMMVDHLDTSKSVSMVAGKAVQMDYAMEMTMVELKVQKSVERMGETMELQRVVQTAGILVTAMVEQMVERWVAMRVDPMVLRTVAWRVV